MTDSTEKIANHFTGPRWYVLVSREPVPIGDVTEYANWFLDMSNRRVGDTKINETTVSTLFLGCDHRVDNNGPPLLFETMIIGGKYSARNWLYSTWDDAEHGHKEACALVEDSQ